MLVYQLFGDRSQLQRRVKPAPNLDEAAISHLDLASGGKAGLLRQSCFHGSTPRWPYMVTTGLDTRARSGVSATD